MQYIFIYPILLSYHCITITRTMKDWKRLNWRFDMKSNKQKWKGIKCNMQNVNSP